MSDPFFRERNPVDELLDTVDAKVPGGVHHVVLQLHIEAFARRLATTIGVRGAAVRLQRLADICAGADVLPVEHWRDEGKRERRRRLLARAAAVFGSERWLFFWLGVIVGIWLEAR